MHGGAEDGCYGCVAAGGGAGGGAAGCYFAGGDVEDCLAAGGACGGLFGSWFGGWWWRGWDGEEGAFVGFCVAEEGGDVVVGEECVGEDFGRREALMGC